MGQSGSHSAHPAISTIGGFQTQSQRMESTAPANILASKQLPITAGSALGGSGPSQPLTSNRVPSASNALARDPQPMIATSDRGSVYRRNAIQSSERLQPTAIVSSTQ